MAKYISIKKVNEFKKALNDAYRDIFKIHRVDELTIAERKVYYKYFVNGSFSLYENIGFNKLNLEEQVTFLNLKKKLSGVRVNDYNIKKALDVLRDAYKKHNNHIAPKWYQVIRRYAYWKELKVIEEYENNLEARGIMRNAVIEAKESAKRVTKIVDVIDNLTDKQMTVIEELDVNEEKNIEFNQTSNKVNMLFREKTINK